MDDMDPATAALIAQMQEEDSRGRRERRAPEVYKPPALGEGGYAKGAASEAKTPKAKADGASRSRTPSEAPPPFEAPPPSGRRERKAPELYKPPPPGEGGYAKSDKSRRTSGASDKPSPASEKRGGDRRGRGEIDASPSDGGKRKESSSPAIRSSADNPKLGKPPKGEDYVHFRLEVWVKEVKRKGNPQHSDRLFKRFNDRGEELPFENCDSRGEPPHKSNPQTDRVSLRSERAVGRYFERREADEAAEKAKRAKRGGKSSGGGGKASASASEKMPPPPPRTEATSAKKTEPSSSRSRAKPSEPAKKIVPSTECHRDNSAVRCAVLSGWKAMDHCDEYRLAAEGAAGRDKDDPEKVTEKRIKLHFVDGEGKSCHQCMQKTANMPCKNLVKKGKSKEVSCFASFCTSCYERYYNYLSPAKMCEKCPRCLNTCVCRKCMRERPFNEDECKSFRDADAATMKAHAARVLDHVAPHLVAVAGQLKAERSAHAESPWDAPEIPEMLPGGTYRLVCDQCSASIADCHRHCGSCESDYCLDCVAEMRALPHYRVKSEFRPETRRWEGDEKCFAPVVKTEGGDAHAAAAGGALAPAGPSKPTPAARTEQKKATKVKCPKCIHAADAELTNAISTRDAFEAHMRQVHENPASSSADEDNIKESLKVATEAVANAREKKRAAIETPLSLKVRCVSVSTKASLAVAKAFTDPLDDVNGLASTYGKNAARAAMDAADALTSTANDDAAAARDAFVKEVFEGAEHVKGKKATEDARRGPESQTWRHHADANDDAARIAAVSRRESSDAPSRPCSLCVPRPAARGSSRGAAAAAGHGGQAPPPEVRGEGVLAVPRDALPIWSPRADDVNPEKVGKKKYAAALEHFQSHWQRGDAVVVRGVEGKYTGCWKPESITRAMTDMSNKRLGTDASRDVSVIDVIDCESGETVTRSIGEFFKGFDSRAYRESKLQQHGLLKLKDWPSEDDFRQKMPRHFTDFVQMLPFQEYTNQVDGPLNLSTKLPKEWVPPDLGPKSYVAMGRVKEHGVGDSVTRLHQDMSDAVNVLVHVGPSQADEDDDGERVPETEEEKAKASADADAPGARWDIFRREDVPTLNEWLSWKWCKRELEYQPKMEKRARTNHPIHDQQFFLTASDLDALREDTGVRPWSFTQKLGDAVFIPSGCPHQVRNLRSCLKVAVDFVSPESAGLCLVMARQLRGCGMEDKLQGRAMILHGARAADEILNGGKQRAYGGASEAALRKLEEDRAAAATARRKTPSDEDEPDDWDEKNTLEARRKKEEQEEARERAREEKEARARAKADAAERRAAKTKTKKQEPLDEASEEASEIDFASDILAGFADTVLTESQHKKRSHPRETSDGAKPPTAKRSKPKKETHAKVEHYDAAPVAAVPPPSFGNLNPGAFAGAAPVNPLLSQIAAQAFQAQAAAQAAAFAPPPQAIPPRSVGAGPGFFNFSAAPAAVSMPPGLGLGATGPAGVSLPRGPAAGTTPEQEIAAAQHATQMQQHFTEQQSQQPMSPSIIAQFLQNPLLMNVLTSQPTMMAGLMNNPLAMQNFLSALQQQDAAGGFSFSQNAAAQGEEKPHALSG